MPVNPPDNALPPPDAAHEADQASGIVSTRTASSEPELNEDAAEGIVMVEYSGVEGSSFRLPIIDPSLDMELEYVRQSIAMEQLTIGHVLGGAFAESEKNKLTVPNRCGEIISAYSTRDLNIIGIQIIDVLFDPQVADKNGDRIIRPEEGAQVADQLESLMRDIYQDDLGKQGSTSKLFMNVVKYFRDPESYASPGGQPGDLGGIHYERMRGQLSSFLNGMDSSDRASIYKSGNARYADEPTVMIAEGKTLLEKMPFLANQLGFLNGASNLPPQLAKAGVTGETYLFAGNRLNVPVAGVNAPDGYILEENIAKLVNFFERYLTGKQAILEPSRQPMCPQSSEQGKQVDEFPDGPSSIPAQPVASPRNMGTGPGRSS